MNYQGKEKLKLLDSKNGDSELIRYQLHHDLKILNFCLSHGGEWENERWRKAQATCYQTEVDSKSDCSPLVDARNRRIL